MRELILGCGERKIKLLSINGSSEYENPTTLDVNPDLHPDIVYDLNSGFMPFDTEFFDEIHAYEVLEHVGVQGDWRFFFRQFEEFWRILKPDGFFMASCPLPNSVWAWGDPGHTRVISPETIGFLEQTAYPHPPRTDYRRWYRGDFRVVHMKKLNEASHGFVLQAVKPARLSV